MTINLEKELLAQNKKLVTPQALLAIKEYEKHEELAEDDSLSRIGITGSLSAGKLEKAKVDKLKKETLRFDQARVFHISQIKSICIKYALRFLPSFLYKGTLDKELPFKINNFEAIYGVKCVSQWDNSLNNTYIVAPAESFNLTVAPKDPLLFYKINDEYYYLIHKWGNDLSWFRMLKSHSGCVITAFLINIVIILISFCLFLPAGFMSLFLAPIITLTYFSTEYISADEKWDSKHL